MRFGPPTEKPWSEILIDGGSIAMPSCLQSSLRMTSLSVLSMSAVMTAAMKASG